MNTVHSEETIGNRTTGITGSSHKYIHLLFALFTDKVTQQTCHEAATYIFKGKRRTVEQFE